MGNKAKELAPITISRLTLPGLHFVGGVAGLALQVLPTGGRTWILRATIGGKRRDMGLPLTILIASHLVCQPGQTCSTTSSGTTATRRHWTMGLLSPVELERQVGLA
jgi:hypothetical protein